MGHINAKPAPRFEIKHKSRRLQKKKLVNGGRAKHVDWGDQAPSMAPALIMHCISSLIHHPIITIIFLAVSGKIGSGIV